MLVLFVKNRTFSPISVPLRTTVRYTHIIYPHLLLFPSSLMEEVFVAGNETTLISLKTYPAGFLKRMVLELGTQLDTLHAMQAPASLRKYKADHSLCILVEFAAGFSPKLKKSVLGIKFVFD